MKLGLILVYIYTGWGRKTDKNSENSLINTYKSNTNSQEQKKIIEHVKPDRLFNVSALIVNNCLHPAPKGSATFDDEVL